MTRRVLVLACLLGSAANAQVFEAATVKPNHSGSTNASSRSNPGTWMAVNNPLLQYIRRAFALPEYRIVVPEWMKTERYDITAKAPEKATDADWMKMTQALLKERFHMEYHWETRTLPAMALILAKGGPKFEEAKEEGPSSSSSGDGRMKAQRIELDWLANFVARELGMPVVNGTGLTGRYNFALEWTAERNPDADAGPTLQTALQEQLGLRLEPRKQQFEVLVVDRAERIPIEN